MRDPFIISTLVDEYAGAVEDHWGNRAAKGIYLLSHWLKFLLCVVAQFYRNSYENCTDNEDIIGLEWMKELFVNYPDIALIKRVEDKYDVLDRLE